MSDLSITAKHQLIVDGKTLELLKHAIHQWILRLNAKAAESCLTRNQGTQAILGQLREVLGELDPAGTLSFVPDSDDLVAMAERAAEETTSEDGETAQETPEGDETPPDDTSAEEPPSEDASSPEGAEGDAQEPPQEPPRDEQAQKAPEPPEPPPAKAKKAKGKKRVEQSVLDCMMCGKMAKRVHDPPPTDTEAHFTCTDCGCSFPAARYAE